MPHSLQHRDNFAVTLPIKLQKTMMMIFFWVLAPFSETLAFTDESTRRKNPEEHHPHHRENLKSHTESYVLVHLIEEFMAEIASNELVRKITFCYPSFSSDMTDFSATCFCARLKGFCNTACSFLRVSNVLARMRSSISGGSETRSVP
jgi:hypothetical protein